MRRSNILGVGTSSAKLFLSLRDVNSPQQIDAYLDMQHSLLPLGLCVGAIVDLTHTRTRITNRLDRIYLVESSTTCTESHPFAMSSFNLATPITSLRVVSPSQNTNAAQHRDVVSTETAEARKRQALFGRLKRVYIGDLLLAQHRHVGSGNGGRNSAEGMNHPPVPMNMIFRFDVSVVNIIYAKVDATGTAMDWEMSCMVDDGTGQATLYLDDDLMQRFLCLSRADISQIESLARESLAPQRARADTGGIGEAGRSGGGGRHGGVLEYSSARRMQAAPRVFGTLSSVQLHGTPSVAFSRRINRQYLLRPLVVYATIKPLLPSPQCRSRTSNIDLGNNSTVSTQTLPKLYLKGVHLEEAAPDFSLQCWPTPGTVKRR